MSSSFYLTGIFVAFLAKVFCSDGHLPFTWLPIPDNTIQQFRFTSEAVATIYVRLHQNKSSGPDRQYICLLCLFIFIILMPLTDLFNILFGIGIIHGDWWRAQVINIFNVVNSTCQYQPTKKLNNHCTVVPRIHHPWFDRHAHPQKPNSP